MIFQNHLGNNLRIREEAPTSEYIQHMIEEEIAKDDIFNAVNKKFRAPKPLRNVQENLALSATELDLRDPKPISKSRRIRGVVTIESDDEEAPELVLPAGNKSNNILYRPRRAVINESNEASAIEEFAKDNDVRDDDDGEQMYDPLLGPLKQALPNVPQEIIKRTKSKKVHQPKKTYQKRRIVEKRKSSVSEVINISNDSDDAEQMHSMETRKKRRISQGILNFCLFKFLFI